VKGERCGFLHLDRAGVLAMVFRGLPLLTGPVTVVVISAAFDPEQQGYYYTFLSILAMQALLEAGLGGALQQITSHEWASLRLDERGRVTGEETARARLAALVRFGLRWYAVAASVAVVGFAIGGALFFGRDRGSSGVEWSAPWLAVSVLAGLNLFLSPGLSILLGCNQVKEVYGFRVLQGVWARVFLWAAMLGGLGLWALAVERAVYALLTLVFFVRRYAAFFAGLLRRLEARAGIWKHEIWPLQWRVGVVWIAGFVPSLFIPALFEVSGPEVAGRMGMTWQVATALMVVAYALVASRTPRMAMHVARREFVDLDRLFGLSLRTGVILLLLGSLAFVGILELLAALGSPLAGRFLPIAPTMWILLALILQQLRHVLGAYLRAHKREPYVALSIVEAALLAAILWPLANAYGAAGLAIGFAVVAAVVFVPALVIFGRCRRRWHHGHDG